MMPFPDLRRKLRGKREIGKKRGSLWNTETLKRALTSLEEPNRKKKNEGVGAGSCLALLEGN